MEFTEEQVRAAKQCRDTIIAEDIDELKSIYMAGEICMWDEMKVNKISSNTMLGEGLYTKDDIYKAIEFGTELGNTAGFEEGHDGWIEEMMDRFIKRLKTFA